MVVYKCKRCNSSEENLPTHQYVKFENRRYDLCMPCWGTFNKWLYGAASKEPKPNPGRIYGNGTVVGREPSKNIITGREPDKAIALKVVVADNLEKWLMSSEGNTLERKTE